MSGAQYWPGHPVPIHPRVEELCTQIAKLELENKQLRETSSVAALALLLGQLQAQVSEIQTQMCELSDKINKK